MQLRNPRTMFLSNFNTELTSERSGEAIKSMRSAVMIIPYRNSTRSGFSQKTYAIKAATNAVA
jgi:hypothetical protein